MIRDPEIAALRTELERLGAVVAPHRDHLCVRLPLFASVRVRVDEQGHLACEPMFGMVPRTRAFLLTTAVLTALAAGALYTGVGHVALAAVFVGVMSGFGSVCRFVLTENCITRVQMVWAARHGVAEGITAPLAGQVPPALRAVDVPPPDPTPPQLAAVERTR